jgi:hypothetical protein
MALKTRSCRFATVRYCTWYDINSVEIFLSMTIIVLRTFMAIPFVAQVTESGLVDKRLKVNCMLDTFCGQIITNNVLWFATSWTTCRFSLSMAVFVFSHLNPLECIGKRSGEIKQIVSHALAFPETKEPDWPNAVLGRNAYLTRLCATRETARWAKQMREFVSARIASKQKDITLSWYKNEKSARHADSSASNYFYTLSDARQVRPAPCLNNWKHTEGNERFVWSRSRTKYIASFTHTHTGMETKYRQRVEWANVEFVKAAAEKLKNYRWQKCL